GIAVVTHPSGNDLRSLRLADSGPIVPGELDGGVVRLRARALEYDARHRHRRDLQKLLGESYRRLVRLMPIEMIVAERAHLLVGDLGEPLGGKAQRRAPKPGYRFDVIAAGIIEHATAFA